MKITLVLTDHMYDCKIKITDSRGERHYSISASGDKEASSSSIIAEVFDPAFSLSLSPVMVDTAAMLNEIGEKNWKDKLAKKASKLLLNTFDNMLLRVGCNYHIVNVQDGDHFDISLQRYAFGTFDRFSLLELFPVWYLFFEVSNCNHYFRLTKAYETNRRDVLKYAKKFSLVSILGEGIFAALFSYPIQMGRVKWLTRNRKISKTLMKFNNLSDIERQRFLEKQEKFFDK